jgi:hypothetical protein
MENSKYHQGRHQWLEEHIGPLEAMGGSQSFILDLHLPIAEEKIKSDSHLVINPYSNAQTQEFSKLQLPSPDC